MDDYDSGHSLSCLFHLYARQFMTIVQIITHMLHDPTAAESLDTHHHLILQEPTKSSIRTLLGLSFLFLCLLLRFQHLLPLV